MNINNNIVAKKRGRPTNAERERLRQSLQTPVSLVNDYSPSSRIGSKSSSLTSIKTSSSNPPISSSSSNSPISSSSSNSFSVSIPFSKFLSY